MDDELFVDEAVEEKPKQKLRRLQKQQKQTTPTPKNAPVSSSKPEAPSKPEALFSLFAFKANEPVKASDKKPPAKRAAISSAERSARPAIPAKEPPSVKKPSPSSSTGGTKRSATAKAPTVAREAAAPLATVTFDRSAPRKFVKKDVVLKSLLMQSAGDPAASEAVPPFRLGGNGAARGDSVLEEFAYQPPQ